MSVRCRRLSVLPYGPILAFPAHCTTLKHMKRTLSILGAQIRESRPCMEFGRKKKGFGICHLHGTCQRLTLSAAHQYRTHKRPVIARIFRVHVLKETNEQN